MKLRTLIVNEFVPDGSTVIIGDEWWQSVSCKLTDEEDFHAAVVRDNVTWLYPHSLYYLKLEPTERNFTKELWRI